MAMNDALGGLCAEVADDGARILFSDWPGHVPARERVLRWLDSDLTRVRNFSDSSKP